MPEKVSLPLEQEYNNTFVHLKDFQWNLTVVWDGLWNLFAYVFFAVLCPPYWKILNYVPLIKRPLCKINKGSKPTADQSRPKGVLPVRAERSTFKMSLLHYITYKLVVIRDRRIGSIYYAIAVLIVLYTLGEIFIKKGYLEVWRRVSSVYVWPFMSWILFENSSTFWNDWITTLVEIMNGNEVFLLKVYVFNWGIGGSGCGFRGEGHPKKLGPFGSWGSSLLNLKGKGRVKPFYIWYAQIS